MSNSSYVETVLQSLNTMETHIDSEFIDDYQATLDSVSRTPRFAMMPEPGVVRVITDNKGVAAFYTEQRDGIFIPGVIRNILLISSDWFSFIENVVTRKMTATGQKSSFHTVTFFPKAPDGIQGEFLWIREIPAFDVDLELEGANGPLPRASVRNLRLIEDLLRARCEDDFAAISALVSPNCVWAERNYLPDASDRPMTNARGAEAILTEMRQLSEHFELERITVLNRAVTDWYAFVEELMVVRRRDDPQGTRLQYRRGSMYLISTEGRIDGVLGYGTDIEPASPTTHRTLGSAYWERVFPGETADPKIRRHADQ